MIEPLVTRNSEIQHGRPCLRGTRFPVESLQSILEVGGMPYLRNQFSSLDGWPDEDLERAATYPRLHDTIGIGGLPVPDWCIDLSDDGSFQVVGFFVPEHAPSIIAAIQQAADVIIAWSVACDEWEPQR